MDAPTLFGMAGGEAGPEAILPLDPFWKRMDEIASSINQPVGNNAPITVVVQLDGREIARTTAPYMNTEINKIQNRENRKLGYV